MDEEPVLKIRKLTIKREDRGEYLRQAENNMHQSIPAELDTLIIGSEIGRASCRERVSASV